MDNACFISPYEHKTNAGIKSLQRDSNLIDDSNSKDYLKTRPERHKDRSRILIQLCMVERVFSLVEIKPSSSSVRIHDSIALSATILDQDPNRDPKQIS